VLVAWTLSVRGFGLHHPPYISIGRKSAAIDEKRHAWCNRHVRHDWHVHLAGNSRGD